MAPTNELTIMFHVKSAFSLKWSPRKFRDYPTPAKNPDYIEYRDPLRAQNAIKNEKLADLVLLSLFIMST